MVIKRTLASLKIQGTILNFRYRFSYIKPTLDYRYDVRAITNCVFRNRVIYVRKSQFKDSTLD